MTKIKICGITNLDDALAAADLGVDFLGFVFSEKSPRQIKIKDAIAIIKSLPSSVSTVGLFVDQEELAVKMIFDKCRLDYFQFHGGEPPDYCKRMKEKGKVIKAFRIKEEQSIEDLANYDVEMYLLDAYNEDKIGGTGAVFNWDLAVKAKKYSRPIIIAGGLNPENVTRALQKVRPYAVDVSSGVEKSPGKKNTQLMKKFIQQVRSAGGD